MIPDDMLPHAGQRRRPTLSQDASGNDVYTYPTSGPDVPGWFQQRSTTEFVGGRQTVSTQWWFFCNDQDFGPLDRIAWGADVFEVDGHPKPVWSPDGFHHLEIPLRRVTG
jgi:hypothetical protein